MNQKIGNKVMSLADATNIIADGDIVTFGGISVRAQPVAVAHEMIRQRKKHIEIAGSAAWHVNNLLIAAGCVDKMLVIADSVEFGGVLPAFKRAVEKGSLIVEDYSYFAFASRLMAAAIGVPFLPIMSMLGSDMLRENWLEEKNKFRMLKCPFSGESVVLVPALSPDVAVIHAQYADLEGNVQVLGPTDLIDEQARSSKKVIVTVEKLISKALTQRRPELTVVPSFLVDAVAKVPFGAHPTAVYGFYDYDLDHMKYAYEQSRDQHGFSRYISEFIYCAGNHREYLRRIGGFKRIRKLCFNQSKSDRV